MFLHDNGYSFYYGGLLDDLNSKKTYIPVGKIDSLYNYFLNLLLALISNNDIVLLDSDLQDKELEELGVLDEVNVSKSIAKEVSLSSFEHLINLIRKSTSKIYIFTSGTTGQPKKIEHTLQNLSRSVRESKQSENIWGFAYSPTHMAGLQVFFQALFNKNAMVNLFAKSRSEVYKLIEEQSITHLSATPTFYRLLLPVEKEYSSVKRLTFGGEKSDSKLYDRMQSIFPNAKINNIYASTEAGSLFFAKGEVFSVPDTIKDKVKVRDNELLIHKTLLGKSEVLSLTDDYYQSGDMVEIISENPLQFRFLSRKNEMINVGGYKVNPLEIEEFIGNLEEVRQVKVYGKPNSVLGNILCVDLVLQEGKELPQKDLMDKIRNNFQEYKIPRIVKYVDKIELTRTGKLKR